MKKLFTVRDNSTGRLVPDEFFDKKKDAKTLRDKLNKDSVPPSRYNVTLGPDHNRF